MVGRFAARGEELRAPVEILEPHQRADALVQRMLVTDHGGQRRHRCECCLSRGNLREDGASRRPAFGRQRPVAAVERRDFGRNRRRSDPRCRGRRRRGRAARRADSCVAMIARTSSGARPLRARDAAHLLVLGAVDDEHPIARSTRVLPARAAAARRGRRTGFASASISPPRGSTNQRMEDCFEPLRAPRRRRTPAVAARRGRGCRPAGECRGRSRDDGLDTRRRRAPSARARDVGVGDVDPELRECVGDNRLAAADAAGQSNDVGHAHTLFTAGRA